MFGGGSLAHAQRTAFHDIGAIAQKRMPCVKTGERSALARGSLQFWVPKTKETNACYINEEKGGINSFLSMILSPFQSQMHIISFSSTVFFTA